MVNDINTLNGALSELGETLAANITTKGVTASASDGLTTLAGKVLQISGDTPTPTPTVLFEDDCSTDKTSQYGNSVIITSGTSTLTFSTDHYVMSGSGGDFNGFVIPNTLGKDGVKVRIKAKLSQTNAYNQFGIMVCNNSTYNINQGLRIRGDKQFQRFDFNPSESESTVYTHSSNLTDWFYYELVKQGVTLSVTMYDSNLNVLGSATGMCSDFSNPNYVFYHLTNRGASYTTQIQEILVESLGGGSDCSQYQTEINNAIEYINGDGS